ncbi:MAG: hypothetical protein ACREXY_23380 [Gammaproteobacteria bacterium]
MKTLLPLLAALLLPAQMIKAGVFDLNHRAWTELLGKHVVLIDQGRASCVAYADLQTDTRRLQNYLAALFQPRADNPPWAFLARENPRVLDRGLAYLTTHWASSTLLLERKRSLSFLYSDLPV